MGEQARRSLQTPSSPECSSVLASVPIGAAPSRGTASNTSHDSIKCAGAYDDRTTLTGSAPNGTSVSCTYAGTGRLLLMNLLRLIVIPLGRSAGRSQHDISPSSLLALSTLSQYQLYHSLDARAFSGFAILRDISLASDNALTAPRGPYRGIASGVSYAHILPLSHVYPAHFVLSVSGAHSVVLVACSVALETVQRRPSYSTAASSWFRSLMLYR
ncbi:hypothetical protein B0H17DRAFT_1190197 [Mycena rosella]|uniref:Uncharacterized protein n=1 Tax=Mycena rosella TaxID=1033263 RepID=A0AAD7H1Z3_MYCRO|nr:hypothetical protein B0H17DRAFT_1190197 [Mycena rosella]